MSCRAQDRVTIGCAIIPLAEERAEGTARGEAHHRGGAREAEPPDLAPPDADRVGEAEDRKEDGERGAIPQARQECEGVAGGEHPQRLVTGA